MSFEIPAEHYDRHVGRYSPTLCLELARAARVEPGMRALDVGAGTGIGTRALADLLGEENVAAVEPSDTFLGALRARLPRSDVRAGSAEALPFDDGEFDVVLAHLVINFLADAECGVGEMRRVAKDGGVVAAAVWDYPGEMTLLRAFWEAAVTVDPVSAESADERLTMRFDEEGELGALWRAVGLRDVEEGEIVVEAEYPGFEALWEPFAAGVGPSGKYAVSLDPERRDALREELRRRLGEPAGSFRLAARAWYAVGRT